MKIAQKMASIRETEVQKMKEKVEHMQNLLKERRKTLTSKLKQQNDVKIMLRTRYWKQSCLRNHKKRNKTFNNFCLKRLWNFPIFIFMFIFFLMYFIRCLG